jgi:ribosomal protein S2
MALKSINELRALTKEKIVEIQKKEFEENQRKEEWLQKELDGIIQIAERRIMRAVNDGKFTHDILVNEATRSGIETYFASLGFKITYNGDERTTYITVSWE